MVAALYWRVDTYRKLRNQVPWTSVIEDLEQHLLNELVMVFQHVGVPLSPKFLESLRKTNTLRRIVDAMSNLADMLRTGFVSGEWSVIRVRPGKPFKQDTMEASIDIGTRETTEGNAPDANKVDLVACTTQLGLHQISSCLPPTESTSGYPRILLKPVVATFSTVTVK